MAKKLFTTIDDNPFKKLYSWSSPERHWVQKDRAWYIVYSLFFLVLIAFLALLGEFLFILLILAFMFLWFVQGATPPVTIEHTVTSLGIRTFDTFFKWKEIKHFWFSKKNNIKYIHFETFNEDKPDFIKRVSLLLNDNDEDLFKILANYLDYGDKEEVGYNIFVHLLNGEYISQEDYLDDKSIKTKNM